MKVHVFMCLNNVVSDTCYTNESTIQKHVDKANEETGSNDFWYKTLLVSEE